MNIKNSKIESILSFLRDVGYCFIFSIPFFLLNGYVYLTSNLIILFVSIICLANMLLPKGIIEKLKESMNEMNQTFKTDLKLPIVFLSSIATQGIISSIFNYVLSFVLKANALSMDYNIFLGLISFIAIFLTMIKI